MKQIDFLADRQNGHYVEPKTPSKQTDEATRSFIAALKNKHHANKVK